MWGRAGVWVFVSIGLLALLFTLVSDISSGAPSESDADPCVATLYLDVGEDGVGSVWLLRQARGLDPDGTVVTMARDQGWSDGLTRSEVAVPRGGSGPTGDIPGHPTPLATIDVPVRPPGPPRGLTAVVTEDYVILTWSPPMDDGGASVEGYAVHRSPSQYGPAEMTGVGDVLTYEDATVVWDGEYTYRVNAINAAGHGELSRPVSVKVGSELDPDAPSPAWLVLMTVTVLALLKVLALSTSEPGRYRLALLSAPLIIRGQKVLDHETRNALHVIILERPGIHYSALREESGLSNGETAYHLSMLERENLVTSVRDGKLKRFYSTDADLPEGCDRSPEELRRDLVDLIRDRPGINQREIMKSMGMDRDCASYYLRNLVKEGRLVDGKDGRFTVYVVSRRD